MKCFRTSINLKSSQVPNAARHTRVRDVVAVLPLNKLLLMPTRIPKHYIGGDPTASQQSTLGPGVRRSTHRDRGHTLTKRRYAHIVGVAPEGGPTPLHWHALLVPICCGVQAANYAKKNTWADARSASQKTLCTPSGIRGARPRSGRFFLYVKFFGLW